MPKKFGVNTKKEEARERKKQKKKEEKERKEKEIEDEYWKEKDPKILEKQAEKRRKEKEKEEKLKEKQRLKEELKKEEEEALNKKKKNNQISAPTRKQIQQYEEERIQKLLKEKDEQEKMQNKNEYDDLDMNQEFVNENYNKLNKKTAEGIDIIEASGVESALQEISLEEYDKHPEKRMRQAWNAFFEKQLPIYKEQYPNLKRQQYINMIQKEFKTSPDNPVYMKKIKDAKKAEGDDDEGDKEDEK